MNAYLGWTTAGTARLGAGTGICTIGAGTQAWAGAGGSGDTRGVAVGARKRVCARSVRQ